MTNILTRDQILAAQDLKPEPVDVPEWGGTVLVRGLNAVERDQYFERIFRTGGGSINVKDPQNVDPALIASMMGDGLRLFVVSCGIVDHDGNRLFSESDLEFLGRKSSEAIERVYAVVQRLSGLGAGEVEAIQENFSGSINGDSNSD